MATFLMPTRCLTCGKRCDGQLYCPDHTHETRTNLDFMIEKLTVKEGFKDEHYREWKALSKDDGKRYSITANNKNTQAHWLYSVFHPNGKDAKNYPRDIRDLAHSLVIKLEEQK